MFLKIKNWLGESAARLGSAGAFRPDPFKSVQYLLLTIPPRTLYTKGRVKLGDKASSWLEILKGVPQGSILGEQDSSPTRQFTDTIFEDSSPTDLKTVHRHFWRQFIDTFLSCKWHMARKKFYYCEEILMSYDLRWYVDIIFWESDMDRHLIATWSYIDVIL